MVCHNKRHAAHNVYCSTQLDPLPPVALPFARVQCGACAVARLPILSTDGRDPRGFVYGVRALGVARARGDMVVVAAVVVIVVVVVVLLPLLPLLALVV